MLILHGAWLQEETEGAIPCLFIWGESSQKLALLQNSEPRPHRNSINTHPFALPARELRQALAGSAGNRFLYTGIFTDAVAFLPTKPDGRPEASPQLTSPWPKAGETSVLKPWKVPGFYFDPLEGVTFLTLIAALALNNTGILISDDLHYWQRAYTFTQQLITNKHYIPSLAKCGYGHKTWYRPVWQTYPPLIREQLELLAEKMPASACHVLQYRYTIPPYIHPNKQDFLLSFIDGILNAIMQKTLADFKSPLGDYMENSPTVRWLHRLIISPSAPLPLVNPLSENLYQTLICWRNSLVGNNNDWRAYRTCFRLENPVNPQDDWQLTFFIHPADDPSLLLSADTVWSAEDDTFAYLHHHFPNLQHKLLQDLGYVAKICPPVAAVLQEPCPSHCPLTTEQAYTFLADTADRLKQAGFAIIVPNWQRKNQASITLRLKIEDFSGPTFLGVASLANYNMSAALGDERVSLAELKTIASLKVPLVHIAGMWREVSPRQAKDVLSALRRGVGRRSIPLGKLLNATITGHLDDIEMENEDTPLAVTKIDMPQKLRDLFLNLTVASEVPEISPPSTFHGILRPYQLRGLTWLNFLSSLRFGACLADDMGLGKTIQIIAYLLHKKNENQRLGPSLILCPLSVATNWYHEFLKFAPGLKILLHHGTDRLSGPRFNEQALCHDVVLTTYSLACRDTGTLSAITWENLILDEAQNIKNPITQQTLAIMKLSAITRIALTGTPVENRLSELWSIMHFLNPGYLGTLRKFKQRYSVPIERNHDQNKQQELQQLIHPFILRRLKTDKAIAPDLPEKQETKVYCQLTKEQATLYAAVLDVMLPEIEAANIFSRKALIAATLIKLKQICNHPAHFLKDGSTLAGRSGKLNRFMEMLAELKEEGRRALIFTQYTGMGHLLQEHLAQTFAQPVLFLHGGLSKSARDEIVTSFQEGRDGPSFFILSLKAGGVGLNLTRADTVFHYDRWWNPAVENQATDRAFRIGQTQNVQVYKYICSATLEEKIDEMIESKKNLAQTIVGHGETWLSELSTGELKKILQLGAKDWED